MAAPIFIIAAMLLFLALIGIGYYMDYRKNPVEFTTTIKGFLRFIVFELIIWVVLEFWLGIHILIATAAMFVVFIAFLRSGLKKMKKPSDADGFQ